MDKRQDKELELWEKYKKKGDKKAKKELINSLKPLVYQRVNQFNNSGLPRPTIELAALKLTGDAIDTYDPSKAQLNTHVTNYLKKVRRFVNTYQNTGAIPEPRALLIGEYKAVWNNLSDYLGREPSVAEIADEMNVPMAEIERLQKELRKDLSIEMDDSGDEGKGGFFSDINPHETRSPVSQALQYVYYDTDPVNKKILEYNFGLGGQEKKNLGDIKKELNLKTKDFNERKKKLVGEIQELSSVLSADIPEIK